MRAKGEAPIQQADKCRAKVGTSGCGAMASRSIRRPPLIRPCTAVFPGWRSSARGARRGTTPTRRRWSTRRPPSCTTLRSGYAAANAQGGPTSLGDPAATKTACCRGIPARKTDMCNLCYADLRIMPTTGPELFLAAVICVGVGIIVIQLISHACSLPLANWLFRITPRQPCTTPGAKREMILMR
jgi:hypothetical protein